MLRRCIVDSLRFTHKWSARSVPHYYHPPFSAGQCEYVNNKVRSWLLPPSLFLSVLFVSPFLPLCSSLLFSRRGGASLSLLECGHPPPLLLQPALLFCPLCVSARDTLDYRVGQRIHAHAYIACTHVRRAACVCAFAYGTRQPRWCLPPRIIYRPARGIVTMRVSHMPKTLAARDNTRWCR